MDDQGSRSVPPIVVHGVALLEGRSISKNNFASNTGTGECPDRGELCF